MHPVIVAAIGFATGLSILLFTFFLARSSKPAAPEPRIHPFNLMPPVGKVNRKYPLPDMAANDYFTFYTGNKKLATTILKHVNRFAKKHDVQMRVDTHQGSYKITRVA